jgi:regulator of nucleoside diphosphate kinase
VDSTDTRRIRITQPDLERLRGVIKDRRGGFRGDQAHVDALERELERAEIVRPARIPPDVVTMRSRVRVRDVRNGAENVYTLVFPCEASVADGRLSVLAPIGTALLGYRQGDIIEWPVPAGMRQLEVAEVLFQPEAASARTSRRRMAAKRRKEA